MHDSFRLALLKLRLWFAAQIIRPLRGALARLGGTSQPLLINPDQLTVEEIILGFDDIDDYLS